MFRKLLIAAALFCSSAAHAEWHEAVSNNFIVYSQGAEQEAHDFAAKLERFRFVLRWARPIPEDRPSGRLRVFLLPDRNAVQRVAGGAGVVGYYVSRARGLMLVGTRHAISGLNDVRSAHYEVADIDPESVLFHEYTHHFTFQYFPATYPTWYSEGLAEFWGMTDILPNDVVEIGAPADHRFSTFRNLGWLPLDRVLRAHNYAEAGGENVFLLYAEGWLLVRYIFEHPDRQRQIQEYLRLINGGVAFDEAARRAIPDLATFNSQLFEYAGTGRFNVVRLPFRRIDVGTIAVRTLRPAEQDLMLDEIKLSQGFEQREAAAFADHVRGIAEHYPDDPFAIRMVMEADYLAGENAQALAAAGRLLALEPGNARALATKGLIHCAALAEAHSTDGAAWRSARQFLLRAMTAAPSDPVILESFYRSYEMQGGLPPVDAQNALYTALDLAPSDDELRYTLAHDFEQRRMIPEAIAIIRPDAYSVPHRGSESEGARRRREQREERQREAGRSRHETALEMLTRLEGELGDQRPQRQAGGTQPGGN